MISDDESRFVPKEEGSKRAGEARAKPLGVLVVDEDSAVTSMLQALLGAAG